MEGILIALNSESPLRRDEMRRLVKAWEDSGRNVQKLLDSGKEPGNALQSYLWDKSGKPALLAVPFPMGSGLQVTIDATHGGPIPMTRGELIKDEARLMFVSFLLNPLRDKLSIRPCARCDKYFIKKRSNQNVYCGRRCGSITSADKANRAKLKKERGDKKDRAKKLIEKWDALKRRPDMSWKQWIHNADMTITPKWLTIAVKNYRLQSPMKEGRNAKRKNQGS